MLAWARRGCWSQKQKENEMAGNEEFSKGQGKLPRDVVVDNALLKPKYEEQELEGKVPVMGSTTSSGGGVGIGAAGIDLSPYYAQLGVRLRRIVLTRSNPTNAQGSLSLPRNAVAVYLRYTQGSGAASTGAALKFVVGASSEDDAKWRLSQAGKHSRMVLGQRRNYMLDSLPVKRIDWQSVSAETGTADLMIEVDVLRPVKTGTAVVLAPLAQLSTDAAIYDESGYERHGAFDAALTAAAAAANPGYLTTVASTVTSQGASFPASIFDGLNPNTTGQFIVRFTADAPPPAAGGQMIAGTRNASGGSPDGIAWSGWPDGKVACMLKLNGVADAEYPTFPGTLVSGVEHHYSYFVDRVTNQFSAWIDNTPIIIQRGIGSQSIHSTGQFRFGNDLSSRSAAGKFKEFMVINASGFTYTDANELVELINLLTS